MVDFIRAHGNQPGPSERPAVTGLLAGLLAGGVFLAALAPAGTLAWIAAAAGLPTAGQAAVLHLLLSAGAGALYGILFNRAAEDRRGGWLFGLAYGFLVWLIGPVTLVQLLGIALPTGAPGLALIGGHFLYGLALGLLYRPVHNLLRPTTRWMRGR